MCSTPISAPTKQAPSGTSSRRMPGRPARIGFGVASATSRTRPLVVRSTTMCPDDDRLSPSCRASSARLSAPGQRSPGAPRRHWPAGRAGESLRGRRNRSSVVPGRRAHVAGSADGRRSGPCVRGAAALRLVPLHLDESPRVGGQRIVVCPGVAPDAAARATGLRRRLCSRSSRRRCRGRSRYRRAPRTRLRNRRCRCRDSRGSSRRCGNRRACRRRGGWPRGSASSMFMWNESRCR